MATPMAPDDVLARVTGALGDKAKVASVNFGQVDVVCDPDDLVEVCTTLRDGEMGFRYFSFLSAIDRTEFGGDKKEEKAGGLEVLIHLYSPQHIAHVNIHVPVDLDDPVCPSVSGVFGGALWQERETHEMFGIDFPGHPGLVPLYLPEDFDGHPLLRSFRLPSRAIKEWPGAKDPDEAAAGGR